MIIPNTAARGRVEINYRNALHDSQELKKAADALKKRSSEMETQAEELRIIWKGHNAERFALRCSEKAAEIRQTADQAASIAEAIRQTAEAYRNAELASIAAQENVMPSGTGGS